MSFIERNFSSSSEKGVIYCAYGEKYLKEAVVSAQILKLHNDIEIALYTNLVEEAREYSIFDHIFSFEPPDEFVNEFVDKKSYLH